MGLVFAATIETPLMVLEATLVEINLGVVATAGGKMNAPTGVAEAVVNCDSLITNGWLDTELIFAGVNEIMPLFGCWIIVWFRLCTGMRISGSPLRWIDVGADVNTVVIVWLVVGNCDCCSCDCTKGVIETCWFWLDVIDNDSVGNGSLLFGVVM